MAVIGAILVGIDFAALRRTLPEGEGGRDRQRDRQRNRGSSDLD